MVEKVHLFHLAAAVGKFPGIGAVGIECQLPGVVQIEGVDQQGGGVLGEGLLDQFRNESLRLLRHPAVHVIHDSGGGQLPLKDLGAVDPHAAADELLRDLPLRIHPQAVGDAGPG